VGTYTVIVPLIIKEISPVEISGTLGTYNQLAICSGGTFACFFAYALKKATGDESGRDFWHILYAFPELILAFQTVVLLFAFPYETPRYLLSVGRDSEARRLI